MNSRIVTLVALLLGWPCQRAYADAPPGRYMFPTPDTVYDTHTKLTWQRVADSNYFSQPDAQSHCASLALDNGGWRLPTRAELLTLVDPTRYAPAIDVHAFTDASTSGFWTATRFVPRAGYGWIVGFNIGESNGFESTSMWSARCVR